MHEVSRRDMTRAQIANCEKLATYLENLPEDYEHFEMGAYTNIVDDDIARYGLENGGLNRYEADEDSHYCGTIACAVGHGPAAGILMRKGKDVHAPSYPEFYDELYAGWTVDWDAYSARFVPDNSPLWSWAFGGNWDGRDNTHRGAAARLRYILAGGEVPLNSRGMFDPRTAPGVTDLYEHLILKTKVPA